MSHPGNGAAESKADSNDLPGEQFSGEILVSSRIIDQLSTNLYESPAACLKELINNSYDADATKVIVSAFGVSLHFPAGTVSRSKCCRLRHE
jgi:hypothetical protein